MKTIRILLTLSVLYMALHEKECHAQRGLSFAGSPADFVTPTQGYPGFFDTNMAAPGSLVVEWPPVILPLIPMPSLAVDYGVSERLTVGTNALVSTIPWLVRGRGISLKIRSLVYGTETMQSTVTVYAGYIGTGSVSASWQALTSNSAWKIGSAHLVSGQLLLMNAGFENGKETSLDYTNIKFSTAAIGGGYQFFFKENMAIGGNLLGAIVNSVEADTVAANLRADLDATSGQLLWGVARVSADLKSDDWVYSIGGIYFHGSGARPMPWFSATTRW
jgi:hypothetical protein